MQDIGSLNVIVMLLVLAEVTDTSVGGALSSAVPLCITTTLPEMSLIESICSTNGVSSVSNGICITSSTMVVSFESCAAVLIAPY